MEKMMMMRMVTVLGVAEVPGVGGTEPGSEFTMTLGLDSSEVKVVAAPALPTSQDEGLDQV